jgi:hypothetical protein
MSYHKINPKLIILSHTVIFYLKALNSLKPQNLNRTANTFIRKQNLQTVKMDFHRLVYLRVA